MVLKTLGVLIGALAGAGLALLPYSRPIQTATLPQQSYASDLRLLAKRASADFRPDGDLSKAVWKHTDSVKFDHDASGKSHYAEVSTRVASVWTETRIYFAFWSRYDSLNVYEREDPMTERWQLWDRDVVEVFLNPQPARVNHY